MSRYLRLRFTMIHIVAIAALGFSAMAYHDATASLVIAGKAFDLVKLSLDIQGHAPGNGDANVP